MALSAIARRTYETTDPKDLLPVKATAVIWEGAAVGITSGYARGLVAGDIFAGFALESVTGTAADGGALVNVLRKGRVLLAVTSVAVTDFGLPVYASADGTFTLTQSTNTCIGRVARYVSSGICIVSFAATDSARTLAGIVSITDSTGGTATGNTINDTTASVKDDLAVLGAKINEIIAYLK